MKKNRKVISRNNLSFPNPTWVGVVVFLLLDRFNAPQWVFGALGLLWVILLAIWVNDWFNSDKIDIFKDK